MKPNSAGLFLYVTNNDISIRHISGEIIAIWDLNKLYERFLEKIPSLIFVTADVEEIDGIEYFHYNRAQLIARYIIKYSCKPVSARKYTCRFKIT